MANDKNFRIKNGLDVLGASGKFYADTSPDVSADTINLIGSLSGGISAGGSSVSLGTTVNTSGLSDAAGGSLDNAYGILLCYVADPSNNLGTDGYPALRTNGSTFVTLTEQLNTTNGVTSDSKARYYAYTFQLGSSITSIDVGNSNSSQASFISTPAGGGGAQRTGLTFQLFFFSSQPTNFSFGTATHSFLNDGSTFTAVDAASSVGKMNLAWNFGNTFSATPTATSADNTLYTTEATGALTMGSFVAFSYESSVDVDNISLTSLSGAYEHQVGIAMTFDGIITLGSDIAGTGHSLEVVNAVKFGDGTKQDTAAGAYEVIASGADTTGTGPTEIEVTGLEQYKRVEGYFMSSTVASSDEVIIAMSVDDGAYVNLKSSASSAGSNDTFSSSFVIAPQPASGYVSGQSYSIFLSCYNGCYQN